jgi:hypothetical protein
MQVSVVRLRMEGVRLRKAELGEPLLGDLQVTDAGETSFRRPVLKAELWLPTFSVTPRPIGQPLFEPRLLRMSGTGFVLVGVELKVQEQRVVEFAQVWRCTLVSDPAALNPASFVRR